MVGPTPQQLAGKGELDASQQRPNEPTGCPPAADQDLNPGRTLAALTKPHSSHRSAQLVGSELGRPQRPGIRRMSLLWYPYFQQSTLIIDARQPHCVAWAPTQTTVSVACHTPLAGPAKEKGTRLLWHFSPAWELGPASLPTWRIFQQWTAERQSAEDFLFAVIGLASHGGQVQPVSVPLLKRKSPPKLGSGSLAKRKSWKQWLHRHHHLFRDITDSKRMRNQLFPNTSAHAHPRPISSCFRMTRHRRSNQRAWHPARLFSPLAGSPLAALPLRPLPFPLRSSQSFPNTFPRTDPCSRHVRLSLAGQGLHF